MYIDSHCHLDVLENLKEVLENAKKKRVEKILANGTNPDTNRKVLELADKYEKYGVKACLGIYPIDALNLSFIALDSEIKFIKENRKKIIGIGEVGMDFKEALKEETLKKQEENLERFVKLAIELNVPVTIHSRKAEFECIEVLERLKAKKVIMHYFSGKLKLIDRIVKNGWYLSVPTAVKSSTHFQKVASLTDIKHLLCETDSPYSHPDKAFPNEPANVIESYKMIAQIKKLKLEDVEDRIEKNFKKLFE